MPFSALPRAVAALALCLAAVRLDAGPIRSTGLTNTFGLEQNDDGSTSAVPIGFTVNFFGNAYSSLFVNNNGNLTFSSALSTFTPFGLTGDVEQPIIAPYFADVDTRGAGSGIVQFGNLQVNSRNAFRADYLDVGYYSFGDDKLNRFQVVLVDRSDAGQGDFDIEFNYERVLWETGGASGGSEGLGGSSARAGYSNGSGAPGTFFELLGSGDSGALLDSNLVTGLIHNSENSGVLGRYVFAVRNGDVVLPGSSQSFPVLPPPPPPGTPPGFFQFSNVCSNCWIDPPAAYGYEYTMTGGDLFTSIGDFPTGFSSPFTVAYGVNYATTATGFVPGSSFDFGGTPVSSFRILGINPLIDDFNNPAAFPVLLNFNSSTASFTMTALTQDTGAVPEPSSLLLLGGGLALLFAGRRR